MLRSWGVGSPTCDWRALSSFLPAVQFLLLMVFLEQLYVHSQIEREVERAALCPQPAPEGFSVTIGVSTLTSSSPGAHGGCWGSLLQLSVQFS